MKNRAHVSFVVAATVAACLAAAPCSARGAASPEVTAERGMELLKSLEGRWVAMTGDGPVETIYEVTAAGSAVMVRQFPGTPHEMVTMYHRDRNHLVLTHYCAAGNQPTMRAALMREPNQLHFRFARGTNMTRDDMHMGDVVITLVDDNHLVEEWTYFQDGREGDTMVFEFVRQR